MKKLKISLILAVVFSLAGAQVSLAKLVEKEGEVSLRLNGDLSFTTIPHETDLIHSGDAIRTGEDSFAEIQFVDDKSKIKVYENSEIGISEQHSSRKINLMEGEIYAAMTPDLTKSYSLETLNSYIGFEAAEFRAKVRGSETFTPVKGNLEVVDLATGNRTLLSAGEEPQMAALPEPKAAEDVADRDPSYVASETGSQLALANPPDDEDEQEETTPDNSQFQDDENQRNWNMGMGVGSVTIDGQIYNQVSLRPELRFGKLGIGLDLYFYFDEEGKIRPDDWDDVTDYLNKIYYVRWGKQGDPFFARAGALNYVTLGYGILMHGYSNSIEYPQVRNIGVHTGMKFDRLGWEIMMGDIKEISGPGLVAGRMTYDLMSKLRLGGTFVADFNQYKGLSDLDGDNVPDDFDAFPNATFRLPEYFPDGAFNYQHQDKLKGKLYDTDSDEDGIPDEIDYDIDGDGLTDNYNENPLWNHDTSISQDPTPFNAEDEAKAISAVAFDAGIPVIERENFHLDIYGQTAFFISEKITDYYTGEKFQPGWGVAIPGFSAEIFNWIHCNVEYRFSGENFLFNYWDRLYDMERVSIRQINGSDKLWAFTKDELKLYNEPMKGVYGSADFNLLDYLIFSTYYQHMASKHDEIRSFRSSLSIPRGRIPKLAEALAFYQRNNDKNPFRFKKPSENTILGYRVGIDIGGGAILSYVYTRTYRDLDGNGKINPGDEAVTINTIETGFRF
ncbi:MAG: FecR domain-containing protein [Candidatus Marinimicrobia bacterium]|nr:FecR domain-containing protein [Candidatus Neomarinimicrobiota bacterium]